MANILQVSPPTPGSDTRMLSNEIRNLPNSPQIQNPSDPTRVVRADGQEQGKTGTSTGEGTYSVIDYGSNYGAFVQRMAEGTELPKLMAQLLFKDRPGFLFPDAESMAGLDSLMERLLASVEVGSREELMDLMMGQQAVQAKFSGPLFDGLRDILSGNASDSLKEAVLAFLKTYNDHSSGQHLLKQMYSLSDDASHLMLKQYRTDFEQLLAKMDWNAANGDTAANTQLLNDSVIPFLSKYISRTHDFGPIRDATIMFILQVVKYENGSDEKLQQLFERMTENREFPLLFKGDAEEGLRSALGALGKHSVASDFAEAFSEMLLKGTNGQAGLDNIQHFYSIMNGMLLNESVYMPLLHMLVPFRYQEKEVVSEMWVDPNASKGDDSEGRRIKMLLRFDVQNLGRFEMLMALQDRQVEMQLYVPPALSGAMPQIQESVAGIIKGNGFTMNRLLVRERRGEIRLEDVFPEIRAKERTINVRI